MAISIDLKDITVSIKDSYLLKNLNLSIEQGKWTCLLGPSGVGKSMLLRAILGLISNDIKSSVWSNGSVHDGTGHPINKNAISFMAQQDLLLPWLNVRDNVTLGTRLRHGKRHLGKVRDQADDLLEAVGMIEHRDQFPASLSGGMAQRVALARTLKEDRPIVLMDEPFSALDAITKIKVQDLSAKLLTGRTVLMVTHDPLEALRLGHQIIVMQGNPAKIGQPINPDGNPPRPVDNQHILKMQGMLLLQLAMESPR